MSVRITLSVAGLYCVFEKDDIFDVFIQHVDYCRSVFKEDGFPHRSAAFGQTGSGVETSGGQACYVFLVTFLI